METPKFKTLAELEAYFAGMREARDRDASRAAAELERVEYLRGKALADFVMDGGKKAA